MQYQINLIQCLIAAITSMAVGFLWYSPILLGKPWMKEMGLTADKLKSKQKEMGKLYGLSFIIALITAYLLSYVMLLSESDFGSIITNGITTAILMWLGFIMPVQLTDQIFGSKNWKLFMINTGYQLVSLIMMGIVIAII